MPAREISDRQRRWLEEQLAEWSRQELITADQAARIRGLYESAAEAGERKVSRFSFAIMGLAAFFVGLAVFLVIGFNWDAFPRPAKLFLIFGTVIGAHAAGLWLRFSKNSPRAGELVTFLACLLYGAGIWLVAQVFHLESHYPDGVWWWAIGVLPFALCLDTMLLHCLMIGLLGTWAGLEVIGFSNLAVRIFWGWWSFPNGAYTLPLLALPGIAWAYRKGSAATVGLYVPLFVWWITLQAISWDLKWQTVYFAGTLGALLLIIAETHRVGSPFAPPIRLWGVVLAAGALIPLSYKSFHTYVMRDSWYGYGDRVLLGALAPFAALVILVAATILLCAYFYRGAGTAWSAKERVLGLLQRQRVPLGLAVGMAAMSLWAMMAATYADSGTGLYEDSSAVWGLMIVANFAMVGLALWLMRVGLNEDRGRPFTFGVIYFLLWSILRYVDLFGDAGGMLGAALMFFLCGAALFGVGLFWRKRKQVQHV